MMGTGRVMLGWGLVVLCNVGPSLQDQEQWAPGYIVNGQGRLIHSYTYDYEDSVPSEQVLNFIMGIHELDL